MSDSLTTAYYNQSAEEYFNRTVEVDMSTTCNRFLRHVKPGGRIIDIGAGSGRDIKYFLNAGFVAEGMDASMELCHLAAKYSGAPVQCISIEDWEPSIQYDGLWANASLLHLSLDDIKNFLCRLHLILAENGVAYMSFKTGIATGRDEIGRFFTDVSMETVQQMVAKSTAISLIDSWITYDKLNRNDFEWINVILRKTQ